MSTKIDEMLKLFLARDIWREPFKIVDCDNFYASDMEKLLEEVEEFLASLKELGVNDLPAKKEFIRAIGKEVSSWR